MMQEFLFRGLVNDNFFFLEKFFKKKNKVKKIGKRRWSEINP